jgi:hypothetical protein
VAGDVCFYGLVANTFQGAFDVSGNFWCWAHKQEKFMPCPVQGLPKAGKISEKLRNI